EKSLRALMTTNLLKRLESSVQAFRLTLRHLETTLKASLEAIAAHNRGATYQISDTLSVYEDADFDDDFSPNDAITTGKKIQISLADMDVLSWEHDLKNALAVIELLLEEMEKVTAADDEKLQHLQELVSRKITDPFNPGNKKV